MIIDNTEMASSFTILYIKNTKTIYLTKSNNKEALCLLSQKLSIRFKDSQNVNFCYFYPYYTCSFTITYLLRCLGFKTYTFLVYSQSKPKRALTIKRENNYQ